jgi:peroxiredoxin
MMQPSLTIGQPAPDFSLPDLDGTLHSLAHYAGRIVVLCFWSAECPWSTRSDRELADLFDGQGVDPVRLTLASNANETVDFIRAAALERGVPLLLLDSQQRVADLYGALTTPHIFIIDRAGLLAYQGAFDDVTFRQRTPTRNYVKEAVQALLAGERPAVTETAAYGCTIVRNG